MESHSTGLMLLLLAFQLPESNPVKYPLRQVNGILGGSVLLPVIISPTKTVTKIQWINQSKSEKTLIVEFEKGTLVHPFPPDVFARTFEMANETTLRIKDLEMRHSGVYMAHVKLDTEEVEDHTFRLTVYEPVPEPKILHQLLSTASDGCHVTLQCQAFGKGEFNVTWKRGNNLLRAWEEGMDWYLLSGNDTGIHLFWQPSSSDSNLTCLVSNPADKKNASFNLLSICPYVEANTIFFWIRIFILVGLIVQIGTVAFLGILERRGP
ncbi:CD48 antigen-like [Hemicordylus capensis]|uniref:CD48 antigen-like n=1 Tax=Hemicordylus capensis TaxID=884348 RepID=UPI002303EFED|nr:CD48 antigen-like [Hemicordylus capensis]